MHVLLFSSLTSGNYTLQNQDSRENYDVYCHMATRSGCGQGGWTLVMKVDGKKVKRVVETA
jgi:hypothetical protein